MIATKSIPRFMKYRLWFFAVSLLFLIPGIASLLLFGLKPAIDFTGGSLIEVQLSETEQALALDQVQAVTGEVFELSSVQTSGDQTYILRGKEINNQQMNQAMSLFQDQYGQVELLRFETVGPILGRELLIKTFVAIGVVASFITVYVWWKFKQLKFGVCAILAMFHDSLILLGAFSLLGFFLGVEVDVLFVTALLTTLSFSVHDTIVVYDRIREKQGTHARVEFEKIVDAAVIETLGRSINNSITIILMLLALVLLGGETIRWFSVALLIGAVTGTYSSTFTAAPLLLLWDDLVKR